MGIFGSKKRIFLDYASATPVLPEVKREMEKYWSEEFFNPSAIYKEGRKVKVIIEEYRKKIAKLLSVGGKDIVFTSGGTESDNLAILGTFEVAKEEFNHPHLIISAIEHPAVNEAAEEVKRRGGEVTILKVDESGRVNPEELKKAIKNNTFLVSTMYANNEIGTIEPIGRIARIVSEYRKKNNSSYPYFHSDCSQAPNYLSMNLEGLKVDMATIDSGKVYGPRGVGALIVRPTVRIRPRILGGGQERGLRSGTENTALIAGFSKALEIAILDREKESKRVGEIKSYFISEIEKRFPSAIINCRIEESLPNIVSVSFPSILSELLLLAVEKEGVLVSTGSSCSSNGKENGSPVIKAIGKSDLAESTIRFSFGKFSKKRDGGVALKALEHALHHVKISA